MACHVCWILELRWGHIVPIGEYTRLAKELGLTLPYIRVIAWQRGFAVRKPSATLAANLRKALATQRARQRWPGMVYIRPTEADKAYLSALEAKFGGAA